MAKQAIDETEHRDIVKYCIDNDEFFKASRDWFFDKYVFIFSERMIVSVFLLIAICAGILNYRLLQRELTSPKSLPIITMERDQTRYVPIIKKLTLDNVARSVDETVIRELVKKYVLSREVFDYQSGQISAYNEQLNYIKNNSSNKIFLDYKNFMNNDANSPLRNFGKPFKRTVELNEFNFVRNVKDHWLSRFLFFLNTGSEISKRALVTITQTDITPQQKTSQRYSIYITYYFNGIRKTQGGDTFVPVKFSITQYDKHLLTN